MSISSLTVQDIRDVDSKEFTALTDDKVQEALDRAKTERDTIYSGQNSTLPTVRGDETEFVKLLAAHHCQLKMGGDPTNESATGGDASYSVVTNAERSDGLLQTKWGRSADDYLEDQQSISVVRSND